MKFLPQEHGEGMTAMEVLMVVQRQGWEGTRGGVYSGERGVPEVQTTGGGTDY